MIKMEFNVSEGVDALCKLVPGFGANRETRHLRDETVLLAARLVSGELSAARMDFEAADGRQFVILIGNTPAEREEAMESRAPMTATH